MSYKLEKPYTDIQRADFICLHQGLNYYEDDSCIIMYADSEKIVDGNSEDQSNYIEYITSQRLKQITLELSQADIDYATILETPVEYTNGFLYQPKYVEKYAILIASNTFAQDIWDYTELNVEKMTNTQLKALTAFLSNIIEPAFQDRKLKRKALLEEKANISV